ncbi:MAG: GUN4 domain-containing protein, partial [Dolichospermum sp.]
GNIMLRSDKQPILIDFGLAGDIAPATSFSRSFGNKNFAPYEQMNGSKEITVDIYGLAATLYYAVTGEYPTTSWDRKYHDAKLIPPKDHCNISNNLNRAILAGMELEAQDRPQTMEEWLSLLNGGIKSQKTDNLSSETGVDYRKLQNSQIRINAVSLAENWLNRPTNSQATDDLSSDTAVDYRKLRDLLAAGNWKQADYETYLVMLHAVGRPEGDWIRKEELLNLPCQDLSTIDNLWVKYSTGKFGFSVQKRIYLQCGGKPDGEYYKEAWVNFANRVGWSSVGVWEIEYGMVLWNGIKPSGHLPVLEASASGASRGGRHLGDLFSRIQTCKL